MKEPRVWVSKHAKKRCRERLRLFMYYGEDPNRFLIGQYRHSRIDMKVEHTPFYKNKLQSKHGANAFVAHTKNITFCCTKNENNDIVICTVYKRKDIP